jgi:nitrite reductase/ring-hydroxylating ferredoxin subunit/alkylhydroperoxidase/carboxymuconolactone decarboxylase family protein YurZ
MSDALTYLVKARPDAMGHYLAFMKDAGSRLDPKTRNLISVITKVHAQTERGLRQYLKRALREGCTPTEVLDALLMAFPALGLAKIVWAVDVILAMKLPGFDLAALDAQPAWHDLGPVDAVPAGSVRRLECDGRAVFVRRDGDDWRVWDGQCPHQGTDIPELALRDGKLVCPKHQWTFDATTGACIENGDRPLTRHEARVENGRLQARW